MPVHCDERPAPPCAACVVVIGAASEVSNTAGKDVRGQEEAEPVAPYWHIERGRSVRDRLRSSRDERDQEDRRQLLPRGLLAKELMHALRNRNHAVDSRERWRTDFHEWKRQISSFG